MNTKRINRIRRHRRVRAKVFGTAARPRLSVFRSNRFVYGQIISDEAGKTVVSVHAVSVSSKSKHATKSDTARMVGREIARRALEKNIRRVVFDRGGYVYRGRIRALAEGVREGGLEF